MRAGSIWNAYNILLNKTPGNGSMTVESDSLPAISDFNIVQDLFQLHGNNGSFADWQAFSGGQDTHSQVVGISSTLPSTVPVALQTLFVNPAAQDYHLADTSPAIDTGDRYWRFRARSNC